MLKGLFARLRRLRVESGSSSKTVKFDSKKTSASGAASSAKKREIRSSDPSSPRATLILLVVTVGLSLLFYVFGNKREGLSWSWPAVDWAWPAWEYRYEIR